MLFEMVLIAIAIKNLDLTSIDLLIGIIANIVVIIFSTIEIFLAFRKL